MPKGEHTGKRGPKTKADSEKKSKEFGVGCTEGEYARFMKAGGSKWAYRVLMKALEAQPAPPQGKEGESQRVEDEG